MLRALLHASFLIGFLVAFLTGSASFAAPTKRGTVIRNDAGALAQRLNMPVYEWYRNDGKPKAIILAIHGLTMHGTVYDTWARNLAAQQFLVVAPDLRGYGQWYASRTVTAVNYKESERDLVQMATALRDQYKDTPLLVAGESLGGTLAVRLAATNPDLIDGLILSAPAIRHYHQVPIGTLADGIRVFANPKHKVDLSPYIKNYFSDDPAIAREEMADPLVRKNLSLAEIAASCRIMCSAADYIADIPADMPVLILQGKKDRMVKLKSVEMLEHRLKTTNQTVCWFPQRGHILLETAHVRRETVERINAWLSQNCNLRTIDNAQVAELQQQSRFTGAAEFERLN